MWGAIAELLARISAFVAKKQELNNTAPMQQAKSAKIEVQSCNKIEQRVAARDEAAARKDWAE